MGLLPREVGDMTRSEFELYRTGYTEKRDEMTRIYAAGVMGIINSNRTRKDGQVRLRNVFPWLEPSAPEEVDDGLTDEDVEQFEREVEAMKAGLVDLRDESSQSPEERAKDEARAALRTAELERERAEAALYWGSPEGRRIAETME